MSPSEHRSHIQPWPWKKDLLHIDTKSLCEMGWVDRDMSRGGGKRLLQESKKVEMRSRASDFMGERREERVKSKRWCVFTVRDASKSSGLGSGEASGSLWGIEESVCPWLCTVSCIRQEWLEFSLECEYRHFIPQRNHTQVSACCLITSGWKRMWEKGRNASGVRNEEWWEPFVSDSHWPPLLYTDTQEPRERVARAADS